MFKCVIVDDEPYAIEVLKGYIDMLPLLSLVNSYTDPLIALAEITAGEEIDFVFLDINMPHISGIDLAVAIRAKARHIIFSSAHREFAYSAFETGADAYLLKPYNPGKFAATINKLINSFEDAYSNDEFFFAKDPDGVGLRKVNYADIYAVESMRNYVRIHLAEQVVIARMNLSEIYALLLKKSFFVQLHRCVIIGKKHIEAIEGDVVEMSNGIQLKIGGRYKKGFFEFVTKNLLNVLAFKK